MIKTLSLKFGRAPELPPETIHPTPVTVFVGPNNSGKSKILAEIHQYCGSGLRNVSDVIVEKVGLESFSQESAEERVEHVTLEPNASERLKPGELIVGRLGRREQISREELIASLLDPDGKARVFCNFYLSYNTLMLNGQNRIGLVNSQNAGDLQEAARTSLQVLFRDNEKEKKGPPDSSRRIWYVLGD